MQPQPNLWSGTQLSSGIPLSSSAWQGILASASICTSKCEKVSYVILHSSTASTKNTGCSLKLCGTLSKERMKIVPEFLDTLYDYFFILDIALMAWTPSCFFFAWICKITWLSFRFSCSSVFFQDCRHFSEDFPRVLIKLLSHGWTHLVDRSCSCCPWKRWSYRNVGFLKSSQTIRIFAQ